MADVLFVSKPVEAPWNDSSKNLVRDVARHLERHRAHVMVRAGATALEGTDAFRVYGRGAGGFGPPLLDNLRVLGALALERRADLWHFFFAPNPRSSAAARVVAKARRRPTVQTLCSAPAASVDLPRVLFADVNVVLSAHTEARLRAAGLEARRIPPAIPPLPVPSEEERRRTRDELGLPPAPLVVYPGDLEFGGGGRRVLEAAAALPDAHVVMACRTKTPRAVAVEAELRAWSEGALRGRVTWIGETPRIHALLGAADVVALPSETLYAKMDYPLVLLEAMSMARPVVVAEGTPAEELAYGGAALAAAPEVDAVRAAMTALLDDAALAARVGAAGRDKVLREHDPRQMARAYEEVYDSLLPT